MKKLILTAAVILAVVGVSYGVASTINAKGVTAHADCDENGCR